ncbi:hypothetical protein FQA39_LY11214 [Lamprigera yunnana]|nr:hypothetical protein FQA39_LY11214 [Lamprigera yunnana]
MITKTNINFLVKDDVCELEYRGILVRLHQPNVVGLRQQLKVVISSSVGNVLTVTGKDFEERLTICTEKYNEFKLLVDSYKGTIHSMRNNVAKLRYLITRCDTFTSLKVSENSSRLGVHTKSIKLLFNFEVNLTLFDDVDVDCGTSHSTPRREVVEVAGKSSAHNDLTTSFPKERWSKSISVYKCNLKNSKDGGRRYTTTAYVSQLKIYRNQEDDEEGCDAVDESEPDDDEDPQSQEEDCSEESEEFLHRRGKERQGENVTTPSGRSMQLPRYLSDYEL